MKGKKEENGRSSTTKTDAKKPKLDVNDPKQLSRKLRSKKNDIMKTKEGQSKFLKEVTKCVDDVLGSKSTNPTLEIDEELYDLLKRINKMRQFEEKYRNKLLTFNDYRIMDNGDASRHQRAAKQKPKDYKEKTSINERRRNKADAKASGSQPVEGEEDDDLQSESDEDNNKGDSPKLAPQVSETPPKEE